MVTYLMETILTSNDNIRLNGQMQKLFIIILLNWNYNCHTRPQTSLPLMNQLPDRAIWHYSNKEMLWAPPPATHLPTHTQPPPIPHHQQHTIWHIPFCLVCTRKGELFWRALKTLFKILWRKDFKFHLKNASKGYHFIGIAVLQPVL